MPQGSLPQGSMTQAARLKTTTRKINLEGGNNVCKKDNKECFKKIGI
jgi:hypothetical protein